MSHSTSNEAKLIGVWSELNALILNFIEPTTEEELKIEVDVEGTLLTLEEMYLDYVQHIDHHLKQIEALQ